MNDPIATPTPSAHGCGAEDELHVEAWLIGLCVALLWFLGSKIHKHIIAKHTPDTGDADADADITEISDSVREVEKLLEYSFKNKRLLEEALTHSSCTESASFQRLEWLGDSALGLAVSTFLFSTYPDFEPSQLSLLRSANTSNEKLARVAVRRRLHWFLEHNATALDGKIEEFALAVQEEDGTIVHGIMKAPKVLADIVESVAGAVYVDCKLDLQVFWAIFRRLLEPIVDPEILRKQPHPVSFLIELCQKDGRKVDFKYREEAKDALVYVDGELIASASSENKENAKLQAARAALEKLCLYECNSKMDVDYSCIHGTTEIEGAINKLYALCGKKRWPKPYYGIVKESGPFHQRRYVEIEIVKNVSYDSDITRINLRIEGDEKSRARDAKNSAASLMIWRLQELKYIN